MEIFSFPFFVIECDKYGTDPYDYIYPEVPEDDRVQALELSLVDNRYRVFRWSSNKQTDNRYYCQFAGGGDLCIIKDFKRPLVLCTTADQLPTEKNIEGQASTGFDHNLCVNVSPPMKGASRLVSLSIETKNRFLTMKS